MKTLLIPIVTPIIAMAMIMLPAAAHAEQCRNSATGKFATCGSPGAVPASQYVAKGKTTSKTAHATAHTTAPAMAPNMKMPAATPPKPGLMSMFKPKAKATPAPSAKPVRCKNAKSKFVKCGTPGAKPA
jgi:cell division septation protein DedD